jgi:hypothetical protein
MKTAPDGERESPDEPPPEPTVEKRSRLLIARLTTRDPRKRLAAARELSEAGSAVVPLLVEALADSASEHKEALLSTLGMMGWRARAAVAAIEKLCEDEQVGEAAREALRQIRRWPIDRRRALEIATLGAVAVVAVLGLVGEALDWIEAWSDLRGPGRAVALGWGLIGGVAGYALGAGVRRCGMQWQWAKACGLLGVVLGAVVGRRVAELLAPLLAALGP